MNTLKELLDKLYQESETRNKENMAVNDYDAISYEVGVQTTIKEIKEWIGKNAWVDEGDSLVVRYKDDL